MILTMVALFITGREFSDHLIISKMPRWTQEGEDAAALCQAINSGIVTDDPKTFHSFFNPEGQGPGARIGERFGYLTKTGQRNLRLNWKKSLGKVELWKSQQPDPKTGKRKCEGDTCRRVFTSIADTPFFSSCEVLRILFKERRIQTPGFAF
jgi:hypothetical protein